VRLSALAAGLIGPLVLWFLAVGGVSAYAAEVVWLTDPAPDDAARIAALAEARRGPMRPAQLRALLSRVTPADDDALELVARTHEDVRVHEAVLDGERLIMEALERSAQAVSILRTGRDRDLLISALLYQGFAVDRFFGPTLPDDPTAAPYRVAIGDRVMARPWVEAFALDPLRRASQDDIGEEPSREAYDALRAPLARSLRASVVVPDLPPGAVLFVDGSPAERSGSALVELLPGRHWLHVDLGGHVIARASPRLAPGQRFELELPFPEADWQVLVRAARAGEGVAPAAVAPFLEALGGELWVALGRGDDVRVVRVDAAGVSPVDVTARFVSTPPRGAFGDVSLALSGGPGLLHSADFAVAPPSGPGGRPLAFAPGAALGLDWDRGWLRYGLGVEVALPVGAEQVALTGPGRVRARALPYLVLGHPLLQVQAGYLFPHHTAGGLVATLPVAALGDGLDAELRLAARAGAGPAVERADGTTWKPGRAIGIAATLGIRARP
jgi:hypothetical protein